MSFKKGIVQPPPTGRPRMPDGNAPGIPTFDSSDKRIGVRSTSVDRRAEEAEREKQEREARAQQRARAPVAPQPSMLLDATGRPLAAPAAPPRVGLVTAAGAPVVGLNQATIKGMAEQSVAANTKCSGCELFFPAAEVKTVVPNAERPNNTVDLCRGCQTRSYKDPYSGKDAWRPSVPDVRFTGGRDDRAGRPYDAKRAGVKVNDLINGDTYHDGSSEPIESPHVTGPWSGGGRVGRQR